MAFDLSIFTTFFPSNTNFWHRYPKGIDNPFNTPGCDDLLSVCRGCLRCVAWFSYWFDNLGFISEGNTYHRCAASSLPLWGNTNVASSDIKRNFWRRCRGGSSQDSLPATHQFLAPLLGRIFNIYQVPTHKSHLLVIYIICHFHLIFLSPTSQKIVIFIRPSFSFAVLLLSSLDG